MTVAVSKAVEEGAAAVIVASTGNTASSAAAYAARAGISRDRAPAARARSLGQGGAVPHVRRDACSRCAAASTRRSPLRGSSRSAARTRSSTRSTRTGARARRPPCSRSSRSSAPRPTRSISRTAAVATPRPTARRFAELGGQPSRLIAGRGARPRRHGRHGDPDRRARARRRRQPQRSSARKGGS